MQETVANELVDCVTTEKWQMAAQFGHCLTLEASPDALRIAAPRGTWPAPRIQLSEL